MFSNGSHVRYRRTDFPDGCVKNNPNLWENNCGEWTEPISGFLLADAVAARSFTIDGSNVIVAVLSRPNGTVRVVEYTPDSSGTLSQSTIKSDFSSIQGEATIEKQGDYLFALWRNDQGEIEELIVDQDGNTQHNGVIEDSSGQPWSSNTSPAVAKNWDTGDMYLLKTDQNDQLKFLKRDFHFLIGVYWTDSHEYDHIPTDVFHETLSQPGLAWVPYDRENDPNGDGHWWIAFAATDEATDAARPGATEPEPPNRLHAVRLEAVSGDGQEHNIGQFGNRWTYARDGTGVHLLNDEGAAHLRGTMLREPWNEEEEDEDRTLFFPFADGEWDFDLEAANDFKIMSVGVCMGLHGSAECEPVDGFGGAWGGYWFFEPDGSEDDPDCAVPVE